MQTLKQALGLGQLAQKMFFSPCLLVIDSFRNLMNGMVGHPRSADKLFYVQTIKCKSI